MLDEELFNDTANTFVCFGRSLTQKEDGIDDKMEKDFFSWIHIIFREIVV